MVRPWSDHRYTDNYDTKGPCFKLLLLSVLLHCLLGFFSRISTTNFILRKHTGLSFTLSFIFEKKSEKERVSSFSSYSFWIVFKVSLLLSQGIWVIHFIVILLFSTANRRTIAMKRCSSRCENMSGLLVDVFLFFSVFVSFRSRFLFSFTVSPISCPYP